MTLDVGFVRLTASVTCVWVGVDSAWEQEKLEARKMFKNAAESQTSGAPFVSPLFAIRILFHRVKAITVSR